MGKPYGAFHNNDGGSELQMAIQAWRPTELYLLEGGSRFLGLIITPRWSHFIQPIVSTKENTHGCQRREGLSAFIIDNVGSVCDIRAVWTTLYHIRADLCFPSPITMLPLHPATLYTTSLTAPLYRGGWRSATGRYTMHTHYTIRYLIDYYSIYSITITVCVYIDYIMHLCIYIYISRYSIHYN